MEVIKQLIKVRYRKINWKLLDLLRIFKLCRAIQLLNQKKNDLLRLVLKCSKNGYPTQIKLLSLEDAYK